MCRMKEFREGLILSLVTCYMFFLYAPLELFFLNQDEFFFDLYILLPVLLMIFLLTAFLSIAMFGLLRKKNKRVYTIGVLGYFVAFICSYIQGNFLVKSLPILDGNWVVWSDYPLERIKCIIVWCVVIAAVCVVYRRVGEKFLKGVQVISICMGLMLLVTTLTVGITAYRPGKKVILNTTTKDLFTMSAEQNFIILLLDAVDAQSFTEVIESSESYSEIFRDFTAFNNTVGAFPSTRESIPYILSGEWYENQTEFDEYEKQAYENSPLFNNLEDQGYQMCLYETDLTLDEGKGRFDNIVVCERSVSSYSTFARWWVQMVGFKYAPFDLKRFCFVNPAAFNTLKVSPNGEEQFLDDNTVFYEKIDRDEIELTTEKSFKFIHLEGGHVPFQYNEKVEKIENGTYEDNLKACLTLTDAYLNKLRKNGVYDNSILIVMADHGYENCTRSNPILYIKGIQEEHEFKVSDAPVSYEDLQTAYAKLLEGFGSNEIFEYQIGDERARRFLCDTDGGPIYEYVQTGHATDENTLKPTGKVFE